MAVYLLGISAYYHDSAAALIADGRLVAAAQEERFTRVKHDHSFPRHALQYVLEEAGIDPTQVHGVAFYEKPMIKFERLLETYHAFAPDGLSSFAAAMPVWIKEKLFQKYLIKKELAALGLQSAPLWFPEHHLSHASSAFYPSPFADAAILTIDGVGEWATTTISKGSGNEIRMLRELHFPHSLGLLYSAFTYYCGFRVNSGEYKLMGLAPYGRAEDPQTLKFRQLICENLVDIRPDGSLLLNMRYFRFATGLQMTHNRRWRHLFGFPPRQADDPIEAHHMNLAFAIQQVTEEIFLRLCQTARELTGCDSVVLAGGVALNCVANGKLLQSELFRNIWIQPAAGDAGGAAGAAWAVWHVGLSKNRQPEEPDGMSGAFLGPSVSERDVEKVVIRYGAVAAKYNDSEALSHQVASLLSEGEVVGWCQGRMEFGPRALGNRSILGDPRNSDMQKKLNLKIKYREGFRPFAPAVLEEDVQQYFNMQAHSPYMLLVAPLKEGHRHPEPAGYGNAGLYEKLYHLRSDLPAVTHIDYSARIQTVSSATNPRFHSLLSAFKNLTGCSVLVNTSFNVRGEPIVCTADDAYRCFMATDMDYLAIDNFLFEKSAQPPFHGRKKGALAPD